MKKRRTMIVNGEHWQVMNRHIATGPSLHWVPPFRPPSKIPETIQSPEAAEKWMKEACEKVEAANAADRKRFFEKPIPSRVDVTINFPLARWHGAITFFEGNRRDISTKDLDAAEIDNLARLHLKNGLVIQGSLDDLTSDELTRHEKILSIERLELPADMKRTSAPEPALIPTTEREAEILKLLSGNFPPKKSPPSAAELWQKHIMRGQTMSEISRRSGWSLPTMKLRKKEIAAFLSRHYGRCVDLNAFRRAERQCGKIVYVDPALIERVDFVTYRKSKRRTSDKMD